MDIDPFKILAAIGTLFTIGDKLYSCAKKWRESRREAFRNMSLVLIKSKKTDRSGIETLYVPGYSIDVSFRSMCRPLTLIDALVQRTGRMNRYPLAPQ